MYLGNDVPLVWHGNRHARDKGDSGVVDNLIPDGVTEEARIFHQQIPGYEMTPLKCLSGLASRLGLGSLWVKDESARMRLNSFKALGSSYAIYRLISQRLGQRNTTYGNLVSEETRSRLGETTFTSATDGNHGKGLAWAAMKLRFPCIIYVHKQTTKARINAIKEFGAEVRVVDGNYDDAVRQCEEDAQHNGWQIVSDTSWPGYEDVPRWVMQGYTTMLAEVQEQLVAQGQTKPTHVFVQAGVGAFAASVVAFYSKLFGEEAPTFVVVEPRSAACLYHSLQVGDGQPHSVAGDLNTIMAGLACGVPSPLAWDVLSKHADCVVTVPDFVAAKGMRMYGVPLKGDPFVVSGESGAVTLGALTFIMEYAGVTTLKEQLELDESSRVLLINTEGNTDPDYFRNVVWDGLLPVPEAYRRFAY